MYLDPLFPGEWSSGVVVGLSRRVRSPRFV